MKFKKFEIGDTVAIKNKFQENSHNTDDFIIKNIRSKSVSLQSTGKKLKSFQIALHQS